MTWQCSACDTINDHNAQACAVCDADLAAATAPRTAHPPAVAEVEAPPKPPVRRVTPLPPVPRRSRRTSGARWIAFVILALAAGAITASLQGGATSTNDENGGSSGSGTSGSSEGTRVQGLTLRRRTYDRFSVDVPASWAIVARDVDHGSYIETEWRSPATGTVFAKVDYTPGFSGTPRSGADSVRGLYTGLAAYHELSYAAYGGGKDGWRWSFEYKGARKVDYFFTACGTGFALLGAAPPGRFHRLEPVYEHMARSLELTC